MTRTLRLAAFILFLSFALLNGAAAPRPRPEPDLAPDFKAGLETVAGTYYLGDGLAANLTLAVKPDGTFNYHAAGCLRTYADQTAHAFMRNGLLMLGNGKSESAGNEARFMPLRWGGRLYLIEPERIVSFANAINAGREPRTAAQGVFYLRAGDWDKPVTGWPKLPEAYRDYLLAKPVEAEVLHIVGDERIVELAAGRRQGLLAGMKLASRGTEEDDFFCKLTIVSVRNDSSTAESSWECSNLEVGDRAFTRWRDIDSYARWEDDF